MKTIKLNRNKIYFLSVVIILLFVIINRINFIYESNFAEGKVIQMVNRSSYSTLHGVTAYAVPVIKFRDGYSDITFEGERNADITVSETVKVVYKKDDPEKAEVFSFGGFLAPVLIYALLPLLLISAAVFSFLDSKELIVIDYEKFYKLNFKKEKKIEKS